MRKEGLLSWKAHGQGLATPVSNSLAGPTSCSSISTTLVSAVVPGVESTMLVSLRAAQAEQEAAVGSGRRAVWEVTRKHRLLVVVLLVRQAQPPTHLRVMRFIRLLLPAFMHPKIPMLVRGTSEPASGPPMAAAAAAAAAAGSGLGLQQLECSARRQPAPAHVLKPLPLLLPLLLLPALAMPLAAATAAAPLVATGWMLSR